MSAHVLLNLLNELGKRDKMQGLLRAIPEGWKTAPFFYPTTHRIQFPRTPTSHVIRKIRTPTTHGIQFSYGPVV